MEYHQYIYIVKTVELNERQHSQCEKELTTKFRETSVGKRRVRKGSPRRRGSGNTF